MVDGHSTDVVLGNPVQPRVPNFKRNIFYPETEESESVWFISRVPIVPIPIVDFVASVIFFFNFIQTAENQVGVSLP